MTTHGEWWIVRPMPITPDLNLTAAAFGVFPFDYDHARETSQLCESIGASLGLAGDELWACRAAGLFHDLGRNVEVIAGGSPLDRKKGGAVSSWQERHPQHALDGAELAKRALAIDVNFQATHLDERVARVIANHNIHGPAPADPIGRALYDADLLESVRYYRLFEGNEGGFERFLASRWSRLVTDWARNPKVHERWRRDRSGAPQAAPAFKNEGVGGKSAEEIARTIMARRAASK